MLGIDSPRSVTLTLAGVLAIAALTGCSTQQAGHGSPNPTSASSVTTSRPPTGSSSAASNTDAPSPEALVAALEAVALKSTDLANGYTLKLIPGGDEVTNQVTLDNCGFTFTTESHRSARRQYGILAPTGESTGATQELVAYDSAAEATLALGEWRQSVATCPTTPVPSTIASVPPLTMTVLMNQNSVAALPNVGNSLTVERASSAQGETRYLIAVQQVHGRYLDSLYEQAATQPDQNEISAVLEVAKITGARLARLP